MGRPWASRSGRFPKVRKWTTVAVTTSPMGGHPAMFTTGLSRMISSMPTAPVGFGLAACTEPKWAQAPTARMAAAPSAASSRISRPVRPPMVR